MTKRSGWAPKRERYRTSAPFGGRKTQTFIAGLRCQAMVAAWIVDAPMNKASFELYVETQLAPELEPGDMVNGSVQFHSSPMSRTCSAVETRCVAVDLASFE